MDALAKKRQSTHPEVIAHRYRVQHVLGHGGTSIVYRVRDDTSVREIALKQLDISFDSVKRKRAIELFEREYHTLMHLSHPRVIEVYDYGIDDFGPYYTMEVLDGGDLRQLSPLPWRKACALSMDVCSALSLLHSRKLVHRDISPRNLHCTSDGLTKLIDFGAMIPMGPCRQIVGTVPFVAPEVIDLQSLDGRCDLYSLGATLYFALTGRNVYAARDFSQIRDSWQLKPLLPSELVEDIPKALDSLVMSLIHLDPAVRPVSAAEVMERLSVIADLELNEHLLVSQAYLSTPTLVGRQWHLQRFRKQLNRVQRKHGGTWMIQGEPGVGRSRFVDACILAAKLTGATVARADASDSQKGDYGAVRALIAQLMQTAPQEALRSAQDRIDDLGQIAPDLFDRENSDGDDSVEQERDRRPRIQNALYQWLLDLSRERCLMLAIDDTHRIDEPSTAFLAFVSQKISDRSIVLAASAETQALASSDGALKLLSEAGTKIDLKNLTAEETEKLLESVFGQVLHIQLLAHRIFETSKGNPRDVMQLAQHLVDRGTIRYQSGEWTIPDRIDAGDLPGTMAQALIERIKALSAEARQLAETMVLSPRQTYSFEDALLLVDHDQALILLKTLDELVAADLLRPDGDNYTISQQSWVSALRCTSDGTRDAERHLKLAKMFELRGQEDVRVARHLLRAGDDDRGVDMLIDFSERSKDLTSADPEAFTKLLQSLPPDWSETFLTAIDRCKKMNRPRRDFFSIQTRMSGLAAVTGVSDTSALIDVIEQLSRDCGLTIYAELDSSLESSARLTQALGLAQQRYDETPEAARLFDPLTSIRHLARAMVEACGFLVTSYDYRLWKSLPSLQPLQALSPALIVIANLVQGVGNRITARTEKSIKAYREILDRIAQPDGGGLEETYRENIRTAVIRAMGMLAASMGLESALGLASELDKYPAFEINALQIRMLYYLWQGDTERAEKVKRDLELLKIQKNPTLLFAGANLARELSAYALADDFTGVKLMLNPVKQMADKYRDWRTTYLYAKGEYHRLRGDLRSALAEFEKAMGIAVVGEHQNWADINGAYLKTLVELGRFEEAKAWGIEALQAAEKADLGYVRSYLRMPLAVAEARLGNHEAAMRHAQNAIDEIRQTGCTGINLGLAYEARATVAIAMKNREDYQTYADKCAEQFCNKRNVALLAKYEKLTAEAHHQETGVFSDVDLGTGQAELSGQPANQMVSNALAPCNSVEERSRCILELLIEHSGTTKGFLYLMHDDGPQIAAQVGDARPPKGLEDTVQAYLKAELDHSENVTVTGVEPQSTIGTATCWTGYGGEEYRPMLLGHHTKEGYFITGIAVLLLDPTRKFRFPIGLIVAISKHLRAQEEVVSLMATYHD